LNCRAAERKDDTVENEQMLEQKKLDEFLQVINENLKELREKKKAWAIPPKPLLKR
jgi:hypothetical protein